MKLKPGELYFVRETDVFTNEISNYVKIGLVREEEGRTSQDRISEHQTGNPRTLHLHTVIKSPAISEIENIMHNLLAENRISGEWFNFTPAELANAIALAQELADEAVTNAEKFTLADSFKDKVSQKTLASPTPEILEWYAVLLQSDLKIKKCESLVSQIREIIRSTHPNSKPSGSTEVSEPIKEVIEKIAKVQERKAQLIFDQERFKLAFPNLFGQFSDTKSRVAPTFTFTRPKDFDFDLETKDPQLFKLVRDVERFLGSFSQSAASMESLNIKSLQLFGHSARASWDKEIAQANLKAFCQDAGGITGVCKWSRTLKETKVFNEKAFVTAHPDLAKDFSKEGLATQAIIMSRKRAYFPRKKS